MAKKSDGGDCFSIHVYTLPAGFVLVVTILCLSVDKGDKSISARNRDVGDVRKVGRWYENASRGKNETTMESGH